MKLRGMPYDTSKTQLIEFLRTNGLDHVLENDVILEQMGKVKTGRAVVFFETEKQVKDAIELINGKYIGSRYVDALPVRDFDLKYAK
jgi:hypothetical protein